MDKMTFKLNNEANLLEDNKKLIDELKHNLLLSEQLAKKGLDYKFIEKYPFKCKRYVDNISLCHNCKGLNNCKQQNQGYYTDIEVNGLMVSENLKMCRYQREDTMAKKHLANFLVNDLPNVLYTVSFDKIDIDNDTDEYGSVVSEVIQAYKNNKGLYLYGNPGTGKTYLAACVANQAAKDNKKVAFVSIPSFFARVKSMISTGEYVTEVNRIVRADVVVFDDIGAESITSWTRDEILFSILNQRMENNRPTWFTSNEDLASLEDRYKSTKTNDDRMKAVRILERIKTLAQPVALLGKDRRI